MALLGSSRLSSFQSLRPPQEPVARAAQRAPSSARTPRVTASAYQSHRGLQAVTRTHPWRVHMALAATGQGGAQHTHTHARTHARTHERTHAHARVVPHAHTHTRAWRPHARTHTRTHTRAWRPHAHTRTHSHTRAWRPHAGIIFDIHVFDQDLPCNKDDSCSDLNAGRGFTGYGCTDSIRGENRVVKARRPSKRKKGHTRDQQTRNRTQQQTQERLAGCGGTAAHRRAYVRTSPVLFQFGLGPLGTSAPR